MRKVCRLAVVAVLISGCSLGARPDSSQFFTLTPLAERADGAPPEGRARVSLGLGPIGLPGYLDRMELVRRVGPNQVRLADAERWAEPLAEGIGRTLQQNLTQLLDAERVVLYPASPRVRVDAWVLLEVLRFEPTADGGAELAAHWMVRDPTWTKVLASRAWHVTEPPSGKDTAAAVAAMSRALAGLSGEIARTVRERVKAGPVPRR
jgi:uncharacterized lipoprotein YmbA